jgi:probable phosphoglycerate mutase
VDSGILARHAESTLNLRQALNGDPGSACPLTPAGEEQARRLGAVLAGDTIDLCVVSEFERAQRTAELALAGRDVPVEVWPELNDPRYGRFEGGLLEDYRAWATAHASGEAPPGGGESRHALVTRYARGLRRLLERPESSVLAVVHSLSIAYVLAAGRGEDPAPRAELVLNAHPYRVSAGELREAVERLEAWCAAPTW